MSPPESVANPEEPETQEPDEDQPSEPTTAVAVRDEHEADEAVEHPTRLLRIAHMVRSMLDEVQTTDLDEAGREHLAEVHQRVVDSLCEVISEDLRQELSAVAPALTDGTPSGSELRIAQAQLVGWLEGLFRGIQASMANQQQLAQQQLEQLRRQQQHPLQRGPQERGGGPGQYL